MSGREKKEILEAERLAELLKRIRSSAEGAQKPDLALILHRDVGVRTLPRSVTKTLRFSRPTPKLYPRCQAWFLLAWLFHLAVSRPTVMDGGDKADLFCGGVVRSNQPCFHT